MGRIDATQPDLGAGRDWSQVYKVAPRVALTCPEGEWGVHAKHSPSRVRFDVDPVCDRGLRGLLHNPAVDISDEGQPLDPVWLEINNNVCGGLTGAPSASLVAERFIGVGWSSRSGSSWESYEVETNWCRIEVDPTDGNTLLNGVVEPQRFEELAALLTRFGLRFSLELYDDDGELLREIEAGAPSTAHDAAPQSFSRLLSPLGLGRRRGGRSRCRSR